MAKSKNFKKSLLPVAILVVGGLSWLFNNINTTVGSENNTSLCLSEFYQNTAPELVNDRLKQQSYPLCYQGFALNYSGISKTPLWVAEKLTPERLAIRIKREDSFHEELRLPENARATLDNYRGSGYDRGHMAPNADMNNKTAQHHSFSLANMVPQTPENNQHTWREIEEATRAMVTKYKLDAYIVTGPAYLNQRVKYIKKGHQVLVPSHVYKAVYFPKVGMASAYFAANDQSKTASIISICDLEQRIGINIFPEVNEEIKQQIYALPMQANKVKASQQPQKLKVDSKSECAAKISKAQLQKTQQQFIIDYDYNNPNSSLPNVSSPSLTTNNSVDNTTNINQILLSVVQWLKQNHQ